LHLTSLTWRLNQQINGINIKIICMHCSLDMSIPLQGRQPATPARIRGGVGQQEDGVWMAMVQDAAETKSERGEVDVDER
jgi:hypothetical protein